MKCVKAFIAESAHLLHPDHNPKVVYLAVDESSEADVPTPPKPETPADPAAAEVAELRARLAALEADAERKSK